MKKVEEIILVLGAHRDELRRKYGVAEVGIFGSYARDEQGETSDIDVLITFAGPVSLLKVASLENYLTDLFGRRADVVPKEDVRPELREEILREAIYV